MTATKLKSIIAKRISKVEDVDLLKAINLIFIIFDKNYQQLCVSHP